MTFAQAEKEKFNPFDLTKVWSHGDYPLIPVGKMVLDENPKNYFTDVEQNALSPSHMVPGIEPSPDKMLQGRLFSYPDTHRHRLGANYLQFPVNCPFATKFSNYQRDGPQNISSNYDGAPNYFPNSFNGPKDNIKYRASVFPASGDVARYNSSDDDNFTQPGIFWSKVLNEAERERLVQNIAGHVCGASDFIQKRAIDNFSKVNPEFGRRLQEKLNQQKLGSKF